MIPQCESFQGAALPEEQLCESSRASLSLGGQSGACCSAQKRVPMLCPAGSFPLGAVPGHSEKAELTEHLGGDCAPRQERSRAGEEERLWLMLCRVPSAEQGYALQCSICSSISRVIFSSEHVSVVRCWYEPLQLAPQHSCSS